MVATVGNGGQGHNHGVPEPGHTEVTAGYKWACSYWQQVHHHMLQGVAVDGSHAHRSSPLVMGLVHQLVEFGVMKQSAGDRVQH